VLPTWQYLLRALLSSKILKIEVFPSSALFLAFVIWGLVIFTASSQRLAETGLGYINRTLFEQDFIQLFQPVLVRLLRLGELLISLAADCKPTPSRLV